jgi:hypothetical protein
MPFAELVDKRFGTTHNYLILPISKEELTGMNVAFAQCIP